ncbi:MAG: energy transducer TonB [Bacteroidetes bacterium]|nr:MAG: energy transducer TonB [Bacteroidota bacterium]
MTRLHLFSLLLWISAQGLYAQADTTIFEVVEMMPRFPACEHLDTTLAAKQQCANQAMLQYIYQQVVYPQEAIEANIQGTAVISFVVEKDGRITQPQIVRDLGGGTGLAALSVVLRMQEEDIRWVPGQHNGQKVRVRFNLPVRFRIEEPDPYILVGRDTVYTQVDQPLRYKGGQEALQNYLKEAIIYPEVGNDSCMMGQIDIQVLIEADGNVRILDITDYNELGFDFWYAAIDAATKTYGNWTPAKFAGRPVNSAFDLSLAFLPTADGCETAKSLFLDAHEQALAGSEKVASESETDIAAGFALLDQAVAAFPRDARLRMLRGQAYLDHNRLNEACLDFLMVRRIALVKWYDSVLPLICR